MGQDPFRAQRRDYPRNLPPAAPPAPPEPPEPAAAPEPAPSPVFAAEADTAPAVTPLDISWPVARLVKWAGKDPEKASQVLHAEQVRANVAGEERRETLWLRLGKVAGG